MSYPIKYPTPQGANIQIFNASETKGTQTLVKPQGASFVWFTLIGAGGGGDGSTGGGGSGAVTNCMVPAFLIPDSLQIEVGKGANTGGSTLIIWQGSQASAGYTLLTANGGQSGGGAGGGLSPSNYFSAMGFYQSIQGDPDIAGLASTTSFLSPGSKAVNNSGNYGYSQGNNGLGYFQMQPIIVGVGGSGITTTQATTAIGCGGAQGSVSTIGGDGLVVIITW